MSVAKGIGAAVIIVLVGIMAGGFLLPQTVEIKREIVVSRPLPEVYDYLRNLQNFPNWSPWQQMDPSTVLTFSGPQGDVQARMDWKSKHPQVGEGYQVITALMPNREIHMALHFGGNYGGDAVYQLESLANGTRVTWLYRNDYGNNVYGRYIGLLIEDMLGPVYERGLGKLQAELSGND